MKTYVADLVDMEADKNEFFLDFMKEEISQLPEHDWDLVEFDDYAQ